MLDPKDYPPIIQAFVITGLHGDRDVEIEFNSSIKVLVGENGLGKTTILNALYAVLSGNFNKLERLNFEEVKLYFEKQEISFLKKDLEIYLNPKISIYLDDYNNLSHQKISLLAQFQEKNDIKNEIKDNIVKEIINAKNFQEFQDALLKSKYFHQDGNYFFAIQDKTIIEKIEEIEKIEKEFSNNILYFPTYRRIEEDLKNLGYDEEEFNDSEQLIQFGMTDVIERFNHITSEIKNSSVEWYSKISGQILEQLVDGIQVNNEMRERVKTKETLTIVLERLGDNIAEDRKVQIGELINDEQKIQDRKYETLIYFLSNLLRVYEQQKDKDNDIKRFSEVCNKYFIDKQVIYDESRVEIKIISKYDRKEVKLEKLSSGEKQIISIFSKLWLENNDRCAFIIDEPELSLSVEWQRQLLPDILASQKCKFLLAATHSPFIFENELDRFTSGILVKARN